MAKQTTLFPEYVEKYFGRVIGKITEKWNDKEDKQNLLYKQMLTQEYSADLAWGSTTLNHVIVAADVVAMDASIPLKKRDKLSNASGKLAKIALKFRKGEKEISDINITKARGTDEATIAAKVLDDVTKVVDGTDARIEIMFERALSTGQMLVGDSDGENDGTGVRATFYDGTNGNIFKTIVAGWENSIATPLDDVQQMFDKAGEDGHNIGIVMLSKKYFNLFRKSKQGKELAATYQGRTFTPATILPVPGRSLFLEALQDEYGAEFRIVDSAFKVQKHDGSETSVKPWEEANVVGIPSENVGRLVYGTLAEETNPVNGVDYQKAGNFLLVSKYSNNDPLEEFTSGQALCLPVIDGADSIYMLEADEVADGVLSVDPDELEFTSAQSTKTAEVAYKGDLSDLEVSADEDFVTVTIAKGVVSVKCSANAGETERTATVTITDGVNSVTIDVEQAAPSGSGSGSGSGQ